jgi:hypothetical protein
MNDKWDSIFRREHDAIDTIKEALVESRTLYDLADVMSFIAASDCSPAEGHRVADEILCEAVQRLAALAEIPEMEHLISSYERVHKWYA